MTQKYALFIKREDTKAGYMFKFFLAFLWTEKKSTSM